MGVGQVPYSLERGLGDLTVTWALGAWETSQSPGQHWVTLPEWARPTPMTIPKSQSSSVGGNAGVGKRSEFHEIQVGLASYLGA